jgi:transcriptional regulator with XRE-family HTH domain
MVVSLKTISRYEAGQSKPRYRKIYDDLAEALDTTHDHLVTDEENFILKPEKNLVPKVPKMQKR